MKQTLIYKILRHIAQYCKSLVYLTWQRLVPDIREIVKAHYCEKRFNIHTEGSLFYSGAFGSFEDANAYQPVPYTALEQILGYLKPNAEDIFVDLGCGKGRAVFFSSLRRMRKVVGVESNKELIDSARRNLAGFRLNTTAVGFVNEDAAHYRVKDETIFFMFNPFGEKTLAKVLKNIKSSLADNPRQVRIAYYSPACRNLLDAQGWLTKEGEMRKHHCIFWRNRVEARMGPPA